MTPHPTAPATLGQRVKLVAPSPSLTLRSPFGTIVSEPEWGGYVAVRLDEPATYRGGSDPSEALELTEIRELPDNMEPA